MKNFIFTTLACMFVLAAMTQAAPPPEPKSYVPNEIIVKFNETAASAAQKQLKAKVPARNLKLSKSLDELNKKYRIKKLAPVIKNFQQKPKQLKALETKREKRILRRLARAPKNTKLPDLDRIYKIQFDLKAQQLLHNTLEDYQNNPDVEYAELNYIISICNTPDDPLYPLQWPLNNISQYYPNSGRFDPPPGTLDSDIDAPQAWDINTGTPDVIVAVIDTGIDYTHRDIDDNMWVNEAELNGADGVDDDGNGYIDDIYGYDFINEDPDPQDDHGHGTHCAGTIAAEGNNALDITGISWNAGIMALKFLSESGAGTATGAAEALYYATQNGADIISNSWGNGFPSEMIEEAVNYAYSQGLVVVAAAGNDNSNWPFYPAYYENAIAVAATNSSDDRAVFSNYGDWVDIAAPGVDVLSLRADSTSLGTPYDTSTTIASGTSMACPHIAGACALLISAFPQIQIDQLRQVLMDLADPIEPGICASGRLNLYATMLHLLGPKGTVWLENDFYSCSDLIEIKLFDTDLNSYGTAQITLSTNAGDLETVWLNQANSILGVFTGAISTASGAPITEDGVLQVLHEQIITATYYDADDGTGSPAVSTDIAQADCQPPAIFNVDIDVPGPEPTVIFETDEPTTARVLYSQMCSDSNYTVTPRDGLATRHAIKLTGVLPRTDYYFIIEANDIVGNQSVDDNAGRCYSFTTDGPGNIYVPSQYQTIQEGIDRSWDTGTVWVADGTYTGHGNRDIDFKGKVITVKSENGPENCVIDCNTTESELHVGFYFHSGETLNSILDGFTIKNGYAYYGGAIYCFDAGPTITNCIIKNNKAKRDGGGIYNCQGLINNCIITQNSADKNGGGLASCSGKISGCLIDNNIAITHGGGLATCNGFIINCIISANATDGNGGGMNNCNGLISNCTIVGNKAKGKGGGLYDCNGFVSNCIIWSNRPADSLQHSSSVPLYSCLQNSSEGTGCTGSDPSFVEPGHWNQNSTPDDPNDDFWIAGDYHLRTNSPCINTGNYAYCMSLPCTDHDGNARLTGGQIDMGCYETNSTEDTDGDWLPDKHEPVYSQEYDRDGDEIPDGVELLRRTKPNVFDPLGRLCVPLDAPTIQEALFFSRHGETIVVSHGTYYENIYIGGRDIILKSTDPNDDQTKEQTIINGDTDEIPDTPNGRVITFLGTESTKCKTQGLTIRGGNVSPGGGGGGVWGGGTNAQLKKCIIRGNTAWNGGGILQFDGIISNCTVKENSSFFIGGGLAWCDGIITKCTISDNSAQSGGGLGWCGGEIKNCLVSGNSVEIYGAGFLTCNGTITNNTITGNKGDAFFACQGLIKNCIVWNNSGPEIGDFATPTYSNIQGGWPGIGNIDADPCFVNPGYWADINNPNIPVEPNDPNAFWIDGDYHLLETSLCVDAGDPNYTTEPNETDLDGKPRIINDRIDMGAHEFAPPVITEMKLTPLMLNCSSSGKWLKAHFVLPEGFSPADVDLNTPAVTEPFGIESEYIEVFENGKGLFGIQIYFDRQNFCQNLTGCDEPYLEITVTGAFLDGRSFQGANIIRLISRHLRHRRQR